MAASATSKEHRASNGIFFRIEGEGESLLLLHGLMASGTMFDPLVELLRDLSPGTIAKLILRASKPKQGEAIGLTREQAEWVQSILAANRFPAMRGAVRGLITFDSRPWLNEIRVPTLVVGGTHDFGVP